MSKTITRREFLQGASVTLGAMAMSNNVMATPAAEVTNQETLAKQGVRPKVYFTKEISQDSLLKVYQALQHVLPGKVAVKLHSGEPGGHYYPSPTLIAPLIHSVNGTIVECNTAYPGKRVETASHMQVMRDHGFTAIAPVDIMDANGSLALPTPPGSKNLSENFVGAHLANYDSFLVFSHFKGHAMGGFGGALKNMSIGIGSSEGKMRIHTAGKSSDYKHFELARDTVQDRFLESMAEAAGSVMMRLGPKHLAYVNLMNNLSVDCDCNNHPAPPELSDIGVLASLDPVALDRACVDLVYSADKQHSAALRERIESRNGTHILTHAQYLKLGSLDYELVMV